jgi:hypothetical protein
MSFARLIHPIQTCWITLLLVCKSTTQLVGARLLPTPGAVVDYEFPRTQCLAGTFIDSIPESFFGTLEANVLSNCPPGLGAPATSSIVSTENNLPHQLLGKEGYTVDLWLKHDTLTDVAVEVPQSVFNMGLPEETELDTCSGTSAGRSVSALDISCRLDGSFVTVRSTFEAPTTSAGSLKCPTILTEPIAPLAQGKVLHLVVSVAGASASIYLNGELALGATLAPAGGTTPAASLLGAFGGSDHRLRLFSDHAVEAGLNAPFKGVMFGLKVYDFALSAAQAKVNFDASLPDSPPSVFDSIGTVNEDGVMVASSTIQKPSGVVPAEELMWVALSAEDQDEDPAYPNFDKARVVATPMRVFIRSLPTRTKLYDYWSGVEITASNAEVSPVFEDAATGSLHTSAAAAALANNTFTKSFRVRVRPPPYEFSLKVSLVF